MNPVKTVIVVAGPTAVGKTAFALRLAETLDTSIISADSRQCYRELNIGVARPSPEELRRVPHYFIASHSITETVNAATFEQYALKAVADIFARRDTVVMVGGTGLYIRAFEQGLDDMPAIPEEVRSAVREGYNNGGLEWLQAALREKDPDWYATGEIQNPHRSMRALEVLLATGRSIRTFQRGASQGGAEVSASQAAVETAASQGARNFRILKCALDLPRPVLYGRINTRVDQMMDAGLLEEVRALLPYRRYNALDTVGYKELFTYLDGNATLPDAVALIKQNTRHYAKRQSTWFKRDPDTQWFEPGDEEKVLALLGG